MRFLLSRRALAVGCAFALFVYACGGDDADNPNPTVTPDGGGEIDGSLSPNDASTGTDANTGNDGGADADADAPVGITPDSGVTTVDWERGGDGAVRILRQASGKLITVTRNQHNGSVVLARFTTAGVIDPTFGDGGYASPYSERFVFGNGAVGTGAVLQSDGKILIVTKVKNTVVGQADVITLLRFTVDGAVDTTFGTQGFAFGPRGEPFDMALQSDGKIIVAGSTFNAVAGSGLARFDTNGALDTTFGTQGFVTSTMASARAVAIDNAGNIVLGGSDNATSWKIARFSAGGTLDTAGFGTQGIATTPVGAPGSANSIAFDGTNVVVSGFAGNSGVVTRSTSAGVLDTTFDGDGVLGPIAGGAATTVAVQADSKIVFVQIGAPGAKAEVRRVGTNGALDNTFDTNGVAVTALTNAIGLLLDPAGNVVVSGFFAVSATDVLQSGSALQRFTTLGASDATFGAGGLVATGGIASADEDGRAILVEPDGGAIVISGAGSRPGVVRFKSNSTLDPAFKDVEDGKSTRVFAYGGPPMTVNAIARDATTGYYAAGGGTSMSLSHVLTTGKLDALFGPGGTIGFTSSNAARAVAVAGSRIIAASDYQGSMRLGSADGEGKNILQKSLTGGPSPAQAHALAVSSDGTSVFVGGFVSPTAGRADGAIAKVTVSTLDPDTTWATSGFTVRDLTPFNHESIRSLALLSDGKILAAGVAGDKYVDLSKPTDRPTSSVAFVARFLANGTIDPSFANQGVWTSTLSTSVAGAFSVVPRVDGSIWVGATRFDGTRDQAVVVRLTANGAPDTTIGTSGVVVLPQGPSARIRAVTLGPADALFAAGGVYTSRGSYDAAFFRIGP